MNQNTTHHLAELFTIFDVNELGHGDTIAGANTLAVMCCALSGIADSGSCILASNGRRMPIGVSVLVSGSASSSRVVDEVTLEVARCQNHFTSHLLRLYEYLAEMERNPATAIRFTEREENLSETSFRSLLNNAAHSLEPGRYEWGNVMAALPRERVLAFMAEPKFFVTTARANNLEKKLLGTHRRRPFVHLGLTRPSELAAFGETVGALLDGCMTMGAQGQTMRGEALLTDPLNTLKAAAGMPDEDTAWLTRILWLGDCDAGPVVLMDGRTAETEAGDLLSERFRQALESEVGMRMGMLEGGGIQIIRIDLTGVQIRWTAFLKGMEGRLPGITGAARNLPATIAYGIVRMGGAEIGLNTAHVEAFARYLVERMANARASILHAGEISLRRDQIKRVFNKLGSIPIDTRTIYQNLNLPADDCRGCLRWLEATNLARFTEGRWIRVDGACLSFNSHPFPLLET